MSYLAVIFALLFVFDVNTVAFDRGGGGGGFHGGGGGGSRPSAPSGGGFNFHSDVNASRPQTNNISRPSGGSGNYNRNGNTNVNRNNVNNINSGNRTVNNVNVNRTVVANPVYRGPAWGWNHGVAWAPAYGYWGGGFWGALAIGVTSAAVGAAVYGSIVSSGQTYTSYQVQQSSPGATLLRNYGLTQTQCGPPNLVVMYGPNNSVICGYPNNTVSAGNYTIDTSTLSLVSQ